MSNLEDAIQQSSTMQEEALEDLKELLRIPSISTLPAHAGDIQLAAEWLAARLRRLGFDAVKIYPTEKHPVVYGEWLGAGPSAPTVLVYGHYDVQPPDPLDEWRSDPFDPVVEDGNLVARGASDMKGQLIAQLKAVEAMMISGGSPINLKYMLEGEEEVGSPNLRGFIQEHTDLLKCDLCLNVDLGIAAPDIPSITYALRGLSYFEIRLRVGKSDLHSGLFGGVVDNPAIVLSRLIAGMKDASGKITLPGFYDDVRPLSPDERAAMSSMNDAWWLEQSGAIKLFGEEGYTPSERAAARPTLDVNGFLSGFTGEGSKTVLPATAMAKISMRLVPDQDPDAIHAGLHAYLEAKMPPTVEWTLREHASAKPSIVDRDSIGVQAAVEALQDIWEEPVRFVRMGGSIPVVGLIQEILAVDTIPLGFALPDDNIHAPNEKQNLTTFFRGIEVYIRFSYHLARLYS